MESLHEAHDSQDGSLSDAPTRTEESRQSWKKAASRNYWAKLNPEDFARFPKMKPLPYLEESRLFERAQNGDTDARNILWTQHLRLAFSVVNRVRLPESLLADAIQEAALGLAVAIQRFEVHRYNTFSTYAWYWMEQRVRRFLINIRYAARIPAYLYTEYHRYQYGLRRCRSGADWYDWRDEWLSSHPKLFERLSRFHRLAHPQSLDDAHGLICSMPDPDNAIEGTEMLALVCEALDDLEKREAYIIMRRYGLDGEPEASLREIGCEIRLTRERVRQLEVKSLKAIRRELEMRISGLNAKFRDNHPIS